MGKLNKSNVYPMILIILFFVVISNIGLETNCYFKLFTGIPSPGCGLTRAYLSLFRLDFRSAFQYHPLFIVPAIALLAIVLNMLNVYKPSRRFWIGLFVVFMGLYIVRMIMYFPHTAPLDFYDGAVIPRVIRFLIKK